MSSGSALGLVPASELQGYSDDRLAWRVALPDYAPSDEIGVDVGRLQRVAHWAGLRHLRIESERGDVTSHSASAVVVDAQGNAMAGSTTSRVEEVSTENSYVLTPGDGTLPSEYQWAHGLIAVNTSEIQSRIQQKEKFSGLVRDPREWSHYLNAAVGSGLRENAKQQLVGNVSFAKKYLQVPAIAGALIGIRLLGMDGTTPIDSPDDFMDLNTIVDAFVLASVSQPGMTFMEWVTKRLPPSERRLSVLPTAQFDRLAVVHGITRAKKLIKPTTPQD